jgi:glycerol-3-phosphate acyltransferase PlsX
MPVAVDLFGGDHAPQAILDGCAKALRENAAMELLLCGDKDVISAYFQNLPDCAGRVEICHAPQVITNYDHPTEAIKQKKDSSLVAALNAVASGKAGCMVSAGSTGAVLAGATLIVRRVKGVKRPGLAPVLPTTTGCVLLIDCGANVDSKPVYLQQFAVMGTAYMRHVLHVASPRVGLLNNGAEEGKGNELTKEVYPLLKEQTPVNFIGNCEARDALSGVFDVVVADGFAGNVLLKSTEGTAAFIMGLLKHELMEGMRTKLGAALAKPAFAQLKKKMDYTEYGGAPLLGINGGIIKAHGSSNAKAFAAALRQAALYIKCDVTAQIERAIAAMP